MVSPARELGDDFRVGAIRLDSGDLGELARAARSLLDAGGLEGVEIFASGGLDEERVARLVADGAPIDGFGVGTRMGTSGDAPSIDMAYKLTEYGGEGRLKLSPGKKILPGPKQVFRRESDGEAYEDVIARADEEIDGRPLLEKVMENGSRLAAGRVSLDAARDLAAEELARLPSRVRSLEPADPGYPVEVSEALSRYQRRVIEEHVDPSE